MLFILAMLATFSVCTSFSGLPKGLRVERVGRIARQEEPPTTTLVPPHDSIQGQARIKDHQAKVQDQVETILHDYPSRSSYVDLAGGCNYYTEDNPPDFTSNEAITLLPLEFFAPRSVAGFFKDFRVGMSSSSFITSLIPQNSNPDFTITDANAKMLLQILV